MSTLEIKQGDTCKQTLFVSDKIGDVLQPADLTGSTLTLHLRKLGSTTDILTHPLSVVDAAGGEALLLLSPEQTAPLTANRPYAYEVELVDADGGTWTPIQGRATVMLDLG